MSSEARRYRGARATEHRDEALHRIRKGAKRLRYVAAATGEPKVSDRAKTIQTLLGDHQDSVTAQGWLREAGKGARAFVAGELTALEREVAARDRAGWHNAWKKLDRKRLRRWMI